MQESTMELAGMLPAKKQHPSSAAAIQEFAGAQWIEGGYPSYSQDRLGRNSRVFRLLKLRTAARDTEEGLGKLLANRPD